MQHREGLAKATTPLLFSLRDLNILYYGEKAKEEFIMGVKKFIKTLITLDKLNQELNDGLNEEIKRLKKQVKEEGKNPKYWKPESISNEK